MDSLMRSPSRGVKDIKADSTLETTHSDVYDFDTEHDCSANQSNCSTNKPVQKIIRSDSELVIKLTRSEKYYRKSLNIDITSNDCRKFLKCTGFVCNRSSLRSAILKGKKIILHPVLGVLFCKKCKSYYCDGEFSMDEDNEDKYCRWCGDGGTLFICSKCVHGFCPVCIKIQFGIAKAKEIKKNDNWVCFFCNPMPLWELRAIAAAAKAYSENKRAKKLEINSEKETEDTNELKSDVTNNNGIVEDNEEDIFLFKLKETASLGETKFSIQDAVANSELPPPSPKLPDSTQSTSSENSAQPVDKFVITRKRKSSKDTSLENENDKTVKKIKISMASVGENAEPATNGVPEIPENHIDNPAESSSNGSFSMKDARLNLKGMFKIIQMTSNLCQSICNKRINRLRYVNSYDSFSKEYDKIKKMVLTLHENLDDVLKTVDVLKKELDDGLNTSNGEMNLD